MPKDKPVKPLVTTYGDHEVITPPSSLRRAVRQVSDEEAGEDPVARAQAALASLSSEFSAWMESEVRRLEAARRAIKAGGFDKVTHQALFHAAHDIKGEAATFGYPFVAASVESLCRLIEHTPDMTRIPLALVDQHVDAVRAIIREKERPDIAQVAEQLTKKLREVTDEFLARANKDRPDILADLLVPSLSPAQ